MKSNIQSHHSIWVTINYQWLIVNKFLLRRIVLLNTIQYSTPLRDQYTPLHDHTKSVLPWLHYEILVFHHTRSYRFSHPYCDELVAKVHVMCSQDQRSTNHAQRYVVIGSLFHKTRVKIDENDLVWWRISYGEFSYGVRHLCWKCKSLYGWVVKRYVCISRCGWVNREAVHI